jgi:hypothetical protein
LPTLAHIARTAASERSTTVTPLFAVPATVKSAPVAIRDAADVNVQRFIGLRRHDCANVPATPARRMTRIASTACGVSNDRDLRYATWDFKTLRLSRVVK